MFFCVYLIIYMHVYACVHMRLSAHIYNLGITQIMLSYRQKTETER